ncbi:MAG TPA: hypothetical protein DEP87_00640 [Candidatus Pacebacteria bacterium]|nr:hypothetical protein [Candidatus Paceibacterota bacterium]
MTFHQLAEQLEQLESTAARLAITAQLAILLNQLNPDEIIVTCYLLQGKLLPSYQNLEFQLAQKLVLRTLVLLARRQNYLPPTQAAVKLATQKAGGAMSLFAPEPELEIRAGTDQLAEMVGQRFRNLGDLGVLTAEIKQAQQSHAQKKSAQKPTTNPDILSVYQQLLAIARVGGTGSQDQKQQLLLALLEELDPTGAKFVIRMVMGKLRLGFSTMTLMDALSWAKHGDKRDREILELAYQKKADIGKLAAAYLAADLGTKTNAEFGTNVSVNAGTAEISAALESYEVEIGVPVMPALCQRLNTAEEIIAKMPRVYAEPKYDGLRLQIHCNLEAGWVKAFTRNLDEVTAMFPELQQGFAHLKCRNCILDAEAVGYDPETGQILSFQATITRKRKHEVAAKAASVPIRCFVFDLMALDDRSLVDEPLSQRKQWLQKLLPPSAETETVRQTRYLETSDPETLHQFHETQLGVGLEGVVVKQADSIYRSGRKGWRWVKIKEPEGTSGKLADTIDCVVMGYYLGKGKRTIFGVGAFLLGVLESDAAKTDSGSIRIVSVAKLGTGLTDEEFQLLRRQADQMRSATKPAIYEIPTSLQPDGWLEPGLVLEIAADEITTSPTHAAGVSLRFPRLVKVRADKGWEQATTVAELKELCQLQSRLMAKD